jgi:predicted Zn-ribbon and HTH transcriptional regulator
MSKLNESRHKLSELQQVFSELENAHDLDGLYNELRSLWKVLERKGTNLQVKQLLKVICDYSVDDIGRTKQTGSESLETSLAKTSAEKPSVSSSKMFRSSQQKTSSQRSQAAVLVRRKPPTPRSVPQVQSFLSEFNYTKGTGAFSKAKRNTFEYLSRELSPGPAAYNTSIEVVQRSTSAVTIPRCRQGRLEFLKPSSPGPAHYSPQRHFLSRF